MTVPVAVEALAPLRLAVSVTAVPVGTLMEMPDWPPPERDVVTLVGWVVTVSTSPLLPQVLADPAFAESPE